MINWMIGKPYSFRSFNCWNYAAQIREDNGIKTRVFAPLNIENAFKLITAEMQSINCGLVKVDEPKNFDIVMCHKTIRGRLVYHCGVYYNGDVNHCSRESKQVIHGTYKEFINGYEGVTFWR